MLTRGRKYALRSSLNEVDAVYFGLLVREEEGTAWYSPCEMLDLYCEEGSVLELLSSGTYMN